MLVKKCSRNGKTTAVEMRKIGRRLLVEEPCRRGERSVGGRERIIMREREYYEGARVLYEGKRALEGGARRGQCQRHLGNRAEADCHVSWWDWGGSSDSPRLLGAQRRRRSDSSSMAEQTEQTPLLQTLPRRPLTVNPILRNPPRMSPRLTD